MPKPVPTEARAGHIDPTAIVSSRAVIAAGAWIGPAAEIGPDVVVGPGAVIGFSAEAPKGDPVRIGRGTHIGPCVCIEPGVEIGPECRVKAGAILRSGTRLAQGVSVGERCVLMGNCVLEEHAILFPEVHVCEYARVGRNCQIMPGVILLNDPYPPTRLRVIGPILDECAIVCAAAILWPGVKLGKHCLVAAMAEVKTNVAEYALVRGQPAVFVCDVREIRTKVDERYVYPYPWVRHFVEGEDVTRPAIALKELRRQPAARSPDPTGASQGHPDGS